MKKCFYCKKECDFIYGRTYVTERKIYEFCSKKCFKYSKKKKVLKE